MNAAPSTPAEQAAIERDFLAAQSVRPPRVKCRVRMGGDAPYWVDAEYVRRDPMFRFHWVESADGTALRVHDQQFEPAFAQWLEVNPYPNGRF